MLIGIAALLVSGGAWALFTGYGFVLYDAASGAASEVRHLNDLFVLQNATWLLSALVAFFLCVALVILYLTERGRDRNVAEIVSVLKAYAAEDWSRTPHVHDGDVEDEIARAVAALAKAKRARDTADAGPRSEAEEIKTRFLEIISHQLRTPLTAVRWNIESLLRGEVGDLTKRQEEVLRITDKNYQNILVMISDWVEALEVERGLLHLNPEPIDVASFIESLAHEFKSQAKLKKLAFRVTVAKDLPMVYADKLKLHYVFSKLLHNAMSYTHEGGRIALRAMREGDFVRFEVHDSGVGIPPDEQQKIFSKFFRASNANLMQPNASGVGLFVAKTLVEAHGGRVGFSSVDGRGTVFHFTLPVSETPNAKNDAATSKKARPRPAPRNL
ncbi:MAG TPA: HAMP domain-containing sensor histidine kinase, partial [Candidatus Baltobacteraceae bacterium]|nr:HAMP domain-containing sensor histidine kinase [Candidatus Baltobacteraceae bacterium]